ncbi:MAG TPA: hypothetical protein VL742_12020 [Casimicrobiaceae bacterium]|nr:hypothetical protein [Casimicrobiaceae bacterium]
MRRKAGIRGSSRAKPRHTVSGHPRDVATLPLGPEIDDAPDQPFASGVADVLDADLRHRLLSEAAFHHQAERGYNSDYDDDDWRDAESEVAHVNLNPRG